MPADPWENSENKNEYNNNSYITLEIENVETESGLINNELQNGEEKIYKQMRKPLLIQNNLQNRNRYGEKIIRTQRWIECKEEARASSHHRTVLSCTSRDNIAEYNCNDMNSRRHHVFA